MDLTFLEVTRWSVVLSDAFSGNLLTWIKIPTTNRPIRHGCGLTYKAMIVAQSTSLHDIQQNDFMSEYFAKPVIVGVVYGTSGFGVCCSVVILLTCIKSPELTSCHQACGEWLWSDVQGYVCSPIYFPSRQQWLHEWVPGKTCFHGKYVQVWGV